MAPAGQYDTKDAGAGKLVSVALGPQSFAAGAGTLLSNYVLPTAAQGKVGEIDPATLIYVAAPVSRPVGLNNPVVTGSVTGLVGGRTLADCVSAWKSDPVCG
jgi:hypothetical protein